MSVPKRPVALSPRAQRDYDDILLHSLQMWGVAGKNAYKATLDQALMELEAFPEIGRARNEIRAGYRSWHVGQHIFFYQIETTRIRVNRILHSRQDTESGMRVIGRDDV